MSKAHEGIERMNFTRAFAGSMMAHLPLEKPLARA
jgi:hypothetical protein